MAAGPGAPGGGSGIPPPTRSSIPRPASRSGIARPSSVPAASSIPRPGSAAGSAPGNGASSGGGLGIRALPKAPPSAGSANLYGTKRPGSALGRTSSGAVPSTPLDSHAKRQRLGSLAPDGPEHVFATPLRAAPAESIATASAKRIARLSMSARRPSSALGRSMDSPASPTGSVRGSGSGSQNAAALAAAELRAAQAEQRLAQVEAEVASQASKLERYERERLDMLAEWEASQSSLQKERDQHTAEVQALRTEAAEARSASIETQRGLEEALAFAESDLLAQRATASESQTAKTQAQHERDQAREEAAHARAQLEVAKDEVASLKSRLDQVLEGSEEDKAKVLAEQEARAEAQTYRKELSQQVKHISELEQSIEMLKRENERAVAASRGAELLKEEKRSLEKRVQRAEAAAELANATASERDSLKTALEQWRRLPLRLSESQSEDEADASYAQAIAAVTGSDAESAASLDLPSFPSESATVNDVVVYILTLSLAAQTALSKIQSLVQSVQQASEATRAERQMAAETEQRASESAAQARAAEAARAAAEAQVAMGQEEVQRVRRLLDTYQAEQRALEEARQRRVSGEHATPASTTSQAQPDYTSANLQRIDALQARVEELERLVADKSESLSAAEAEVERLRQAASIAQGQSAAAMRENEEAKSSRSAAESALSESRADLERVRDELAKQQAAAAETEARMVAEHEASVAQAQKEIETLGQENAHLYDRLGRGEFDPEKYKVVTLKAGGPYEKRRDLRAARLDALKKENEALLQQLERAQEQLSQHASAPSQPAEPSAPTAGPNAELVPRAVADNLRAEVDALQAALAARDKAMLRLRQVFTAKAGEFREAVRCLFGWKLRFLDSGQVKLVSSFSSAAARRKGSKGATTLTFASHADDQGTMRLIPDAQLDVDVEHLKNKWLAQPLGPGVSANDAIPCFLSELTQHLFESCTRVARAYGYLPDEDEDGAGSAPSQIEG